MFGTSVKPRQTIARNMEQLQGNTLFWQSLVISLVSITFLFWQDTTRALEIEIFLQTKPSYMISLKSKHGPKSERTHQAVLLRYDQAWSLENILIYGIWASSGNILFLFCLCSQTWYPLHSYNMVGTHVLNQLCGKICGKMEKMLDWNKNWCGSRY